MGAQQLVMENLRLAASIAGAMAKRLPRHVDPQDVHQDARLGLICAAAKYEPRRKVAFGSYARGRIGGAVLDGLRQTDHLSRSARARIRAEGTEPPIGPLQLDTPEKIPGALVAPDQYVAGAEQQRLLTAAMDTLPPRLRIVVRAYYHGGKTMHEIGNCLGVNESRISQIHARALCLLRRYFKQRGLTSYAPFAIPRSPEVRP